MNMVRAVAQVIADRGPSTLDDIAPLFPDVERRLVQKAMGNGKTFGILRTSGQLVLSADGRQLAVYEIVSMPDAPIAREYVRPHRGAIPNVNSVWGLASA